MKRRSLPIAEMSAKKRRVRGTLRLALPALLATGSVLLAAPAVAGPPFITDDPVPVDLGHWEVYAFSNAAWTSQDGSGTLIGTEINYGAAPNLQLHVIVPMAFDAPSGEGTRMGPGDIELGAKYRFLDTGKDGWQIGAFPLLEIPAGDAREGLGAGHARLYLPVWIQEEFGSWTTYGGGGLWLDRGGGARDHWFAGWLLQRQLTTKLALGAEVFHQTSVAIGARAASGFNVGATYDFSDHYHLLASAGRDFESGPDANRFAYYLGFQWTF
ncbi:MAG: hypothetical protein ACRED8_06985 [Caulobacteraceae bacterium]